MNFSLNVILAAFFFVRCSQRNNYNTCRLDADTPVSDKKNQQLIIFGMS